MRRRRFLGMLGGALALRGSGARAASAPTRPPLVVVAAQGSPLVQLSRAQLRAIYLGDAVVDPGGRRIVPMNHAPNTADRIAFDRQILGMEPGEAGRYWLDRRLRGQGAPPRSFDSPVLLQRLICRIPGAIAYVRADQLIAGVQIVRIDGKTPADPGYAL